MMERDVNDQNPDVLATRPNGRSTAPFAVNRGGQRKSLFAGQDSKDKTDDESLRNGNAGRLPGSGPSSDNNAMTSPPNTRIPRPSQQTLSQPRRPFTIAEAYKMAEEEEAAQGSPSPAPRPWRTTLGSTDKRMQEILSQKPLDFGSRGHRPGPSAGSGQDDTVTSADSASSAARKSDASESDIDQKLRQYEEDQMRMEDIDAGKNGIFNKTRVGPKVAETGRELARKASNNSLDGNSPSRSSPRSWGAKAKQPNKNWLRRFMASPDPDDQAEAGSPAARPAGLSPENRSPEKSYAWQVEGDFTAGDLQVSQSPPVSLGRTNTKIDEIRELEAEADQNFAETTRQRPRNTRLDEIRALEIEAAAKYPDESLEADSIGSDEIRAKKGEGEGSFNRANPIERANKRADDIRAKEIESLSKRALATARLDEIRERNPERRSVSPAIDLQSSNEFLLVSAPGDAGDGEQVAHDKTVLEKQGEQIPNTPITIFRKPGGDKNGRPGDRVNEGSQAKSGSPSGGNSHSPEDSRDLLRRLARATSTSPAPEKQNPKQRRNGGEVDTKAATPEIVAPEETRPSVGFTGLPREASAESISDKRSSMAVSDSDPIERIEAEMKLFAPLENHSERGSIRAPSPDSEEDSDENPVEETPRPNRIDPLTQPTPRVTGAYVETPATVKVEKEPSPALEPALPEIQRPASGLSFSSIFRGRRANSSPRKSTPSISQKGDKATGRSSSASVHGRTKSSSRVRPVVNTAKVPSVKDDLLAIHRAHRIEDSTLDDLGDLLAAHQMSPPATEKVPNPESTKTEDVVLKEEEFSDRERELETYDRMSKSLKTGLLGIRVAKQGIERLEDKVSQSDSHHLHTTPANVVDPANCPHCAAQPPSSAVAYIHVPVPRLYHRHPTFKLTTLGLVVVVLSLWLALESTACYFFCRPEFCYPNQPCDWSPDDPYFGCAFPVKIDQWATGGRGRIFAEAAAEDISDWVADVWDAATGTDITQVDVQALDWHGRRQHRRRLRKKGLLKPRPDPPEHKAKFDAWRAASAARERAESAREMGYDVGDGFGDESMSADEKVRRW